MKAQQTGVAVQGFALLVKDSSNNYYQLNAEGLNALVMLGESMWTEDILDERTAQATILAPVGTALGVALDDEIEVPAGEVWFVNTLAFVVPALGAGEGDFNLNALISSFPPVAATAVDKAFLSVPLYVTNGGLANTTYKVDVATGLIRDIAAVLGDTIIARKTPGLGTELRLVGPATVTFTAVVTELVAVNPITMNLNLYGRKVHKVVG